MLEYARESVHTDLMSSKLVHATVRESVKQTLQLTSSTLLTVW